MATGNLFLGQARGKVGSVVFSKLGAKQITRVHNATPKNPKTDMQTIQRAIAATTMYAYSYLQEVCNHSFEGTAYGAASQQLFLKLNMDRLRRQYATAHTTGNTMCFSKKASGYAVPNSYIISKGSITNTPVGLTYDDDSGKFYFDAPILAEGIKPSEWLQKLGLKKYRDQITFLAMIVDESKVIGTEYDDMLKNQYVPKKLHIERVIRNDVTIDDTKVYSKTDEAKNKLFGNEIVKALNFEANWLPAGDDVIKNGFEGVFQFGGIENAVYDNTFAAGIIYSSYDENKGWLRSNSVMLNSNKFDNHRIGLNAAYLLDYWADSSNIVSSSRLLNNGNA